MFTLGIAFVEGEKVEIYWDKRNSKKCKTNQKECAD